MATNYGRDISCLDSLKTGRFSIGVRLVAESAYRRLTTPRGMLTGGDDEDDFGLDLTDLIGSVSTTADEASLPGRIENELKKDERITAVGVRVVNTSTGPARSFEVFVDAETDEGPFDLQLSVSDVTVDLLGINAE